MTAELIGQGLQALTNSDTRSSGLATRVNIQRATLKPNAEYPKGYSQLYHSAGLQAVAVKRANRMINELWSGHRDLQGKMIYWDMVAAGLIFEAWGENVMWGEGEPDKAYQRFIESPTHKANIEHGEYNRQGIAFVFDPVGGIYTSTLTSPWTQSYRGPNWFIVHAFMEVL